MAYNSGKYKKHFPGREEEYESFMPSPVNREYAPQDKRILVLLEEATQHVGELKELARRTPDIDTFIRMHVRNEAVKSSKIEGTKTSMDEAVLTEKEISPERRDDWVEVQNYIEAMNHALGELENGLPVCMRLIRNAHRLLLQGVRGEHKQPGEIRNKQNWIGGTSIRTASFIPPHQEDLSEVLKDLERFWHNKALCIPNLIRIAISHYQFETIHPFNDGNGRIGRMLIVLQLIEMNMLEKPVLYISDFFEKHRSAYYDGLSLVREKDDMDQWLVFFLEAVSETAKKGKSTLQKIVDLKEKYRDILLNHGKRTKSANELLSYSFSNPAFDTTEVAKHLGMAKSATNTLIQQMMELKILEETTGFSRNRIFKLREYIETFE